MLIDVHTHLCPVDFPDSPSAAVRERWPCMQCNAPGTGTIMIGDKPFRQLDSRSWDAARRLDDMARDRVDMHVLSPMPELLSYWFEPDAATVMCDHVNGRIAEIVARDRAHFRGLGMVPLQDPKRAAEMLRRCRDEFGLSGVEIGSNINGAMIGDRKFDPFYEAANDLGMAIFVHALHPVATKAINAGQPFTAFAGFPIDTAMAVASLILEGTIERYPNLRIGFSHGGGAIGSILGRLDVGWNFTKGFGGTVGQLPSSQAHKFFCDSNVYDPVYLRHLATSSFAGRVFLGTDYPYDIMQRDPNAYLLSSGLTGDALQDLKSGAAGLFLGESFAASG